MRQVKWAFVGLLVLCTALAHAQTVAYFTDNNETVTDPAAAITTAGFTPLQITDISTFNFASASILFLNEENNAGLSGALVARLGDIQTYVQNGGKFMVHDRLVAPMDGVPSISPFLLGQPGTQVQRDFTNAAAIDFVDLATNPVANGPAGPLDNASLDGGSSSSHGFVLAATEPVGAVNIAFRDGEPNNIVALDYSLGSGFVYYSTIPLDAYLSGLTPAAFANPYAPNVLSYVNGLLPASVPEPGSIALLAGMGLSGAGFLARRRKNAHKVA